MREVKKGARINGEVFHGSTRRGIVKTKKSHYAFNYWIEDANEKQITYHSPEFYRTQNLNRMIKEYEKWVKKVEQQHDLLIIEQVKNQGKNSTVPKDGKDYSRDSLRNFTSSMTYKKDLINYYAPRSIGKNREFFDTLKNFDPQKASQIDDVSERRIYKNKAKTVKSVMDKQIRDISAYDVYQLFTALNFDETTQKNRLKPATIKRYKSNFSMPFKTLIRWGMLENNVVDTYSPPKTYDKDRILTKQMRNHGTKKDVLEVWEMEVVEKHIEEMPKVAGTVVQFALMTGLRNGEIYGLTWDNIDFARKRLYVSKVLTYNEISSNLEIKYETKNGDNPDDPRVLALYPKLERLLIEYRKWQDKQYAKREIKRKKPSQDYVFCKNNGEWYNLDYFSAEWRRFRTDVLHVSLNEEEKEAEIREAQEIDGIIIDKETGEIIDDNAPLIKHKTTFHNLRGTFASYLLNTKKVPATIVKDLLGHTDIQTTVDYYVNTTDEHYDQLIDTLFP
ncbi:hypothetical protein FG877_02105 [Enterococcus casseliflavus]|nr:hypothetical protein [Enterococcus casseliflavus]